jgi:hypothetical protein
VHTTFLSESLKGRDLLDKLGVNGRINESQKHIILRMGFEYTWLIIGTSG